MKIGEFAKNDGNALDHIVKSRSPAGCMAQFGRGNTKKKFSEETLI